MHINRTRFQADFDALAQIGATTAGGVNRPALSASHLSARAWLRERILQAGLEFRQDGAGNLSAFLPCGPAGAPTLLLGSHLDSVPDGGRYDGALGVVAALEVVRTVAESGLRLPYHLEAIDFTDEEGTLVGLLGSAALAGHLTAADLIAPRGGRDRLIAGLERAGLPEPGLLQAARDPGSLAGYLELHIEQGRRLEKAGTSIGVVTAIAGIASYQVSFTGRADHAGTTTMEDRLDAAQGAAQVILDIRRLVMEEFPGCVANVGSLHLSPGAFNIVPAQAVLSLELRAPDAHLFRNLQDAAAALINQVGSQKGLPVKMELLGRHAPAPMHTAARRALSQAAEMLGLSWIELPSGAGHDAQSLAPLCPAGMVFIPSVDGASHSGRELSRWDDCVNGANVLLQAAVHFGE